VGAVVVSFILSLFLLTRIGTEFAPELEEGAVLVKAFMDPNVSLEEGKRVAMAMEKEVLKFPEVIKAYSTIGRAEKGEAADVNYIETWIILKPQNEWGGRPSARGRSSTTCSEKGSPGCPSP